MTEHRCPVCGGPLQVGPRLPPSAHPPVDGAAPVGAERWDCVDDACRWSSLADVPGTEGGDNGGA